MNHLLEIKNLDVFYGDIQVLWGVSLHAEEGAIVALIGSNGAGKTTLLKTISGLLRVKKGEILFSGESLQNLKPQMIVERGIIHVPEARRLFVSLTVMENLKMGAYLPSARFSMAESLERVFNLFPVLKNRKNQKAGTLSGGEQQMLAIGRALMARPRLIMLDEPSLGLSPLFVKSIFELIKVLKEQKVTILLVEQNVNQALKIADEAYVLKTGKIVMHGTGSELLQNEEVCTAYIGKRTSKQKGRI